MRSELSYEKSSIGWDPPAKKQELFHPLGRFALVRQVQAPSYPADTGGEKPRLCGYAIFRFEREDGENVVYW
jgi:N-alpha-acetyltransferase 40